MRPYNPSNVLLPCDQSERDNSTDNSQLKLESILYFPLFKSCNKFDEGLL